VAGLWTIDVAKLAAMTLPAMAIGTLIGRRVNRRIDPMRFRWVIYVALLILGIVLFVK
jgi:uncharacterized membrane protein YfcA